MQGRQFSWKMNLWKGSLLIALSIFPLFFRRPGGNLYG